MDLQPPDPAAATSGLTAIRTCAFLAVLLSLLAGITSPALATTESVVHSFGNPPDAYGPRCNLVADAAGNLYGTTFSGGVNNLGAVFVTTPAGAEHVLYSFTSGTDGTHPIAGLVYDKKTGNLYGTTVFGGTANSGTVFVVNATTGAESVLYSFKGGLDGANPYSALVRSGTTIFGTTMNGGQFGYGTVFVLTAKGKETVLHSFNSAFPTLDGSYPYAGLVLYKGLLYGTTTLGGASNLGTVFSISKAGSYALLYSFKGGTLDGQSPFGGVLFDKAGIIYGTTFGGGTDNAGVVYSLSGGADVVLHSFLRNSADGINPYSTLILFKKNFYGTATGGNSTGGTVFKVTPSGVESTTHTFSGGATDGFNPYGALVVGADKKTLYGTTVIGGSSNLGTVFKVVP